jgi:hypothetical protein
MHFYIGFTNTIPIITFYNPIGPEVGFKSAYRGDCPCPSPHFPPSPGLYILTV